MDLNKDVSKEAPKAVKESQKNSINENQHGAMPIDPPPSYNEAIKIHPYQDLSYSAAPATAPSLDTNNAISYPYNNFAPGSFPQSGVPHDKRFQQWDSNATRIVVIKRLQMNDRFRAAKQEWETQLLWNIIMNDLLIHGYHFGIFDLMQYWAHLFQFYTELLHGIASGGQQHTDWEYFPFMHQTFGSNDGSRALEAMPTPSPGELPVSATDAGAMPVAMAGPPEPQKVLESSEAPPTTLPNPPASRAPEPAAGADLPPSESLLEPPPTSAFVSQLSSDDRAPLLLQNDSGPSLHSEILAKSSDLVTESSSEPISASASTLLPASATIPTTSVVPAVMTIPPSEPVKVSLPSHEALAAASGAPLPGDVAPTVPLLNPLANAPSAEQASFLLPSSDAVGDLSPSVWVKSNAIIGEQVAKPVFQTSTADQAAAGVGESISSFGPIDDLMKCIPPVEFSASPALGLAAVTAQPDGLGLAKILEDSSVITSQPSLAAVPPAGDSYADEYGCCDSCCGEDFCCGDCYCEGGDCDLGDCGGF